MTNFVETLLSYDGKLDERLIMGVLMVHTDHCNQYIFATCVFYIPIMFYQHSIVFYFLVHALFVFFSVIGYDWRRNKFIHNDHGMGINRTHSPS
jgi:hypothetical protein